MNPAAAMIILSIEVVVYVDEIRDETLPGNAKFQEQTKIEFILDLGIIWLHVVLWSKLR